MAELVVKARGVTQRRRILVTSREQVLRELLSSIWIGDTAVISSASQIDAARHPVVHGGPHFEAPVAITPDVRSAIAGSSALAPLHIRSELEGMGILESLLGAVPQVAVFDTGFHGRCRSRRQSTQVHMNSLRQVFDVMDFTPLVISTLPDVRPSRSGRTCDRQR